MVNEPQRVGSEKEYELLKGSKGLKALMLNKAAENTKSTGSL